MARSRVRIRGKRALKRKLENYADEVRNEVKNETEKQAFRIENIAKRLVPVESSNLQKSISVSQDIRDQLIYYVGSSLEYAAIIEFGYTGVQQVQAHRRVIEKAFGKKLDQKKIVSVEAHTRRVDREGHFYLTRAAMKVKQTHKRKIQDAVQRAG
jgi:phage gpG-like protein